MNLLKLPLWLTKITLFESKGMKRALAIVLFTLGTIFPGALLSQEAIFHIAQIIGMWGLTHAGLQKVIEYVSEQLSEEEDEVDGSEIFRKK
jgi:hypothetical protein